MTFSKKMLFITSTTCPWFHLHLPSCGPGFDSQALHLRFFQFVLLKLYRENNENNENKQKEAGIGPFFKKNIDYLDCIEQRFRTSESIDLGMFWKGN